MTSADIQDPQCVQACGPYSDCLNGNPKMILKRVLTSRFGKGSPRLRSKNQSLHWKMSYGTMWRRAGHLRQNLLPKGGDLSRPGRWSILQSRYSARMQLEMVDHWPTRGCVSSQRWLRLSSVPLCWWLLRVPSLDQEEARVEIVKGFKSESISVGWIGSSNGSTVLIADGSMCLTRMVMADSSFPYAPYQL